MTLLRSAAEFLIPLLAVLAAVTWYLSAHRTAAWETRYPPEGRFIDVGGTRVHYVQSGQGPDVVLIHGASGNTRDMTLTLAPLLAKRYRVTVFDRPGLGYTDRLPLAARSDRNWPHETPTAQAALLAEAAAQLGVTTPIVVGHSYGGAVGIAWALDHPASGFVDLCGAVYPWGSGVSGLYNAVNTRAVHTVLPILASAFVPESTMEKAALSVFPPEPPVPDYYHRVGAPLVVRPASMRANAEQVYALHDDLAAMANRYPSITMPVEILHGSRDTTVYLDVHSRQLAATLPQARLTILDNAGHMINHTRAPEVVAAVDRIAATLRSQEQSHIVGRK